MTFYNLKRAFRNLLKNKLYSILILGGFSIGFASAILIGLFYFAEHRYNKDFPNYRRIYRVVDSGANKCLLDYNMFPILSEKYPSIENACPLDYLKSEEMVRNEQLKTSIQVNGLISTTNNFFKLFSVEIIGKMSSQPLNGNQSAVITITVAKALFGSQNPLGQKIRTNAGDFDVTAIINDLPANSTFKADIILNSENKSNRFSTYGEKSKSINLTSHFILVKPGTDLQALTANLNKTMGSYGIEFQKLELQKISAIYFSPSPLENDYQIKGNPKMLRIFLSIALLIIILTSINYVNYTISMQYTKLKEIGIHKTHGSSRYQLADALVTEVSLGVLISTLISVFILLILIPYSKELFGKNFILNLGLIMDILPFSILFIFLIIAVNSIAPVYILSKFRINDFLLGSRKRRGKAIGQKILILFQLTVSIGLITGVLIIFKQVRFFKHADLGFNKELLLKIDFPPWGFPGIDAYRQAANAFREETAKLPFVKNAALSDGSAGNIQANFGMGKILGTFRGIYSDEDYLKTMGIRLLQGREFHEGDENKVCLMNEEAIKRLEWKDFEGKRFDRIYEVVGVVKNFNVKSLHTNIDPLVIFYKPRNGSDKPFFSTLSVRLSPGHTGEQLRMIKQVWKRFVPNEPMSFMFYDDQFQSMYEKEERLAQSISFFSLVALALTCMGILGHIFMICLNRVKEIGIRKVNGSKIWEIMLLLMKDSVRSVLISLILATPISYYIMSKWLENFAYKTTLSWWIFVLAGFSTLLIVLLTVSWQSWKAASTNPLEALRYE